MSLTRYMKLPPRTQKAVCHAGRPRRLSRPTTSMCALPTRSTPNLTSYSIFSPTANGTFACLTPEVTTTCAFVVGTVWADATAVADSIDNTAGASLNCLTPHLPARLREHALCC